MKIGLFVVYGFLLSFALRKIPFFRATRLRPAVVLGLFALEVLAGCLHNWIAWKYYPGHGDIWRYFLESFLGRQELHAGWSVFWADNRSWAYMPHNSIEWMHMLLNVFSDDSLYVNTLLFSFPVFWGKIALFRVFRRRFPGSSMAALSAFLVPSCLFFSSCINTEAIIFALLGFLLFYVDRSLESGATIRRTTACIFFLAALTFYRPSILFALAPALLLWIVFDRLPSRRHFTWAIFVLAGLLLVVLLVPSVFTPILRVISHRQQEFQALTGNSRISLPVLDPSPGSFGRVFPYALRNGFFEPLPGQGGQAVYQLFSLELIGIWVLVIASLILNFRLLVAPSAASSSKLASSSPTKHQLVACSLQLVALSCLPLFGMLEVGYIVPFIGAIIRYRSIFLPFLLAPALFRLRQIRPFSTLENTLSRLLFS
jgi:hypothetical protein